MIIEPWLCFFVLCKVCLHTWKLCSCNLLFSNNKFICSLFIFCTVLCLIGVGYPGRISHQQPKTLWAAMDCKKNYCRIPLYGWLETANLKRCRIITLTYALNEVVTILEVWVQKTATLVKKWTAKITEPICLWSPDTKVQVLWGCI